MVTFLVYTIVTCSKRITCKIYRNGGRCLTDADLWTAGSKKFCPLQLSDTRLQRRRVGAAGCWQATSLKTTTFQCWFPKTFSFLFSKHIQNNYLKNREVKPSSHLNIKVCKNFVHIYRCPATD